MGSQHYREGLEELPGIQTLLAIGLALLFGGMACLPTQALPLDHIGGHEHGQGATCLPLEDGGVEMVQHMRGEEAERTWREVETDLGLGEADLQLGVVTIAKDASQALQIVSSVTVGEAVGFAFLVDGQRGEAGSPEEATVAVVML